MFWSVDLLGSAVAAGFVVVFLRLLNWAWLRPRRLDRALRAQGLRGTTYRFVYGDAARMEQLRKEREAKPLPDLTHDIIPRIAPLFQEAMREHGKISFIWLGPHPAVTIMDPGLVKEVLSTKFGDFQKLKPDSLSRAVVTGLLLHEGEKWANHRRIIKPAFHLDKLKCMLPAFSECCNELIERWEKLFAAGGGGGSDGEVSPHKEVDVWPEFQSFTGDSISRTAFGSSFKEGRRIFHLQNELGEIIVEVARRVLLPGYRYLLTKTNKRIDKILAEIDVLMRGMIEQREEAIRKGGSRNTDLLALLLESNLKESAEQGGSETAMTTEDVIGECRLFYLAGQETMTVLLTWTMVALSMHPVWQARAREEVLRAFGKSKPDYNGLSRLKIVTMVIYEVLRLYPPATMISRETYKEMKLGDVTYPPGVELVLPIVFIHRDPEFWGPDAGEFNPERFAEGISQASRVPGAFIPFSGGPRVCVGQSFALLEAKLCLARILQHFSFELSPSYAHAPYNALTLHPQFGAPIIMHRL
ncbi:cytochrome P450 72A11-like [Ananas comosus]|uniref:Cytochrome P450 72A11-like n=1 Tax=Ananas comosus TaxID=4615 RepID=A0A6P5FPK8_ANACO|nr:cytochrome P450 72A11-like [Ananas comosus]